MSRNQKREELYTIRTQQRSPITQHRLKKRLEFGETEKAISGSMIPQHPYPTEKKGKTEHEPTPIDENMLKETSPYTNLDIEKHPTPPEKAETPQFVKDIGRKWMDYEFAMGGPSRQLRAQSEVSLITAERLKLEGEDVRAGLVFSRHFLESVGAGLYDIGTTPFRPIAVIETVTAPVRLATDKELREAFIGKIRRDPMSFIGELTGGFLGGAIWGDVIRLSKGKYQAYKMTPYEQRRAKLDAYLRKESRGTAPRTVQKLVQPEQVYVKPEPQYQFLDTKALLRSMTPSTHPMRSVRWSQQAIPLEVQMTMLKRAGKLLTVTGKNIHPMWIFYPPILKPTPPVKPYDPLDRFVPVSVEPGKQPDLTYPLISTDEEIKTLKPIGYIPPQKEFKYPGYTPKPTFVPKPPDWRFPGYTPPPSPPRKKTPPSPPPTPKPFPKQVSEKQIQFGPFYRPPQTIEKDLLFEKKKEEKKKRRLLVGPLMGWETRSYDIPSIDEMMGKRKTRKKSKNSKKHNRKRGRKK